MLGQLFRLVVVHHVAAVGERELAEIPECGFALRELRGAVGAPAADTPISSSESVSAASQCASGQRVRGRVCRARCTRIA